MLLACFCLLIFDFSRPVFAQGGSEGQSFQPKPIGTVLERVEGHISSLNDARVFTFGDGNDKYSLIFKSGFETDNGSLKFFNFLPNIIESIIKIPENEIAFLSDSITLEEDFTLKDGFRITKMNFPSSYWGVDEPRFIKKTITAFVNKEEGDGLVGVTQPSAPLEIDGSVQEENIPPKSIERDTPKRAVWIKNSDLWQKHHKLLLDRLEGMGVDKLFLEIEVGKLEVFPNKSVEMEMFNKSAHAKGFKVWASFKHYNVTKNNWQKIWSFQAKAVQNFNNFVGVSSKFDGIQFDIKPHLIDDFDLVNVSWQMGFLKSISDLESILENLKIYLSIPNWFPGFTEGELLSEKLPQYIEGLTIIDFRTERFDINRTATPFLNWGERHNKEILVGLETGEPQFEKRRSYIKSLNGRILLTSMKGDYYLLFLNKNITIPQSDLYSLAQFKVVSNKAGSFFGSLNTLFEILPILESDMAYFLTFQGIALNNLPGF